MRDKKDHREFIFNNAIFGLVGQGFADDYYLDAKGQCAGGRGACPDAKLSRRRAKNDVRLLNSAVINDFNMLTFRRYFDRAKCNICK